MNRIYNRVMLGHAKKHIHRFISRDNRKITIYNSISIGKFIFVNVIAIYIMIITNHMKNLPF